MDTKTIYHYTAQKLADAQNYISAAKFYGFGGLYNATELEQARLDEATAISEIRAMLPDLPPDTRAEADAVLYEEDHKSRSTA